MQSIWPGLISIGVFLPIQRKTSILRILTIEVFSYYGIEQLSDQELASYLTTTADKCVLLSFLPHYLISNYVSNFSIQIIKVHCGTYRFQLLGCWRGYSDKKITNINKNIMDFILICVDIYCHLISFIVALGRCWATCHSIRKDCIEILHRAFNDPTF